MAVATLALELPTVEATEPTWEELLGSKEWNGLLDPLDLNLRKLILRCGEFCQATGDAFNNVTDSKYCGSCYFSKESFFDKVYLPSAASDYKVVAYLYTTTPIDCLIGLIADAICPGKRDKYETNWMGYIAVTTDEVSKANGRREIYVAWRGTMRPVEWEIDFDYKLVSAMPLLTSGHDARFIWDDWFDVMVSEGWLKIYTTENPDSSQIGKTSARTQLRTKINELVNTYKGEAISLTFSGHSLGGALAAISTFDVATDVTTNMNIPVAAFVFGMPKLGNKKFCNKIKEKLPILHVKNGNDIVPKHPIAFVDVPWWYSTVGTEIVVDTTKSKFLKSPQFILELPGFWHNLEVLLHMVAGWNGNDEYFERKVKRALALVNKAGDYLNPECLNVPASWWVVENKGMVLDEDGEWDEAEPDY